jgi:hypothetical protein
MEPTTSPVIGNLLTGVHRCVVALSCCTAQAEPDLHTLGNKKPELDRPLRHRLSVTSFGSRYRATHSLGEAWIHDQPRASWSHARPAAP